MLKFNTSCAVLAYLSSNLLNEVGLSLFLYFEVGLRVCDIVVKKFTFAISSPDEFLFTTALIVDTWCKLPYFTIVNLLTDTEYSYRFYTDCVATTNISFAATVIYTHQHTTTPLFKQKNQARTTQYEKFCALGLHRPLASVYHSWPQILDR